jgi:hypothetical protein
MRFGQEYAPMPPPWQPDVWSTGPDGEVDKAKRDLFSNYKELEKTLITAAGGGAPDAISGNGTAPSNESDQLVSTHPGATNGVTGEWKAAMQSLKQTEPLAEHDLNPAP